MSYGLGCCEECRYSQLGAANLTAGLQQTTAKLAELLNKGRVAKGLTPIEVPTGVGTGSSTGWGVFGGAVGQATRSWWFVPAVAAVGVVAVLALRRKR